MRVVDYDLYSVPPRWLFLRVETSDGLVGWGEPVVEGRARTVRTAVEELLETYLLGEDPLDIEDHWQTMYRGGFYRGGQPRYSSTLRYRRRVRTVRARNDAHIRHPLIKFFPEGYRHRSEWSLRPFFVRGNGLFIPRPFAIAERSPGRRRRWSDPAPGRRPVPAGGQSYGR